MASEKASEDVDLVRKTLSVSCSPNPTVPASKEDDGVEVAVVVEWTRRSACTGPAVAGTRVRSGEVAPGSTFCRHSPRARTVNGVRVRSRPGRQLVPFMNGRRAGTAPSGDGRGCGGKQNYPRVVCEFSYGVDT